MNIKNFILRVINGSNSRIWMMTFGAILCLVLLGTFNKALTYTSTDNYCMSCHVHPWATESWKLSPHHNNRTGVSVHCVECHLPPQGEGYLLAKAKHGSNDVYVHLFKDSSKINWESKRLLENAKSLTYESSCIKCHSNLFPVNLSVNGSNANMAYISAKADPNADP